MAYEPLHHKYRPQCFADLVGQEAIARTLSQALAQQRIAPAYLFTGPRGTGKTSSARILAKSLNCQASPVPTASPCGTCEACRAIARGNALDVIEIDAASNTGVDNIRELIERAQFAPVQCRFKVYVIDECHMLSTAAFNALLKTLEEPPDRVVFVLATTDPQRVLPTIISRCQRFDFRRIPLQAMTDHLQVIAQKESIEIEPTAIALVAQLAQGGLRDAESLLDQLGLLPPPVTPEAVWDLLGAVPERQLLQLLEAIAANDPEALLTFIRQLLDRGREPLTVLQNLTAFSRDLLIARTAPQRRDLTTVTEATWQALCTFAQDWTPERILQLQQHLRQSELQIKNTTQPRLWLEVALLGLLPSAQAAVEPVAAPPVRPVSLPTPVSPTVAASPAPPTTLTAAPVAPPAVATPAPVSPAPEPIAAPQPDPLDLEELWQRVLANIASRGTQMLLRQQGHLLRCQAGQAVISLPPQWLSTVQSKRNLLAEAFQSVLGQAIAVELASSSGAAPNPVSLPAPPTVPVVTESVRSPIAPSPSPRPAPPSEPTAIAEPSHQPAVATIAPPAPAPAPVAPIQQPKPVAIAASPPKPTEVAPAPRVETPPTAPRPRADWELDPGLKAAKSLAQFFNGEVVSDRESDSETVADPDVDF
ncbi:DNA polymerase III subunit gamma/tau [Synechococcus elongatus]|uniref:DNA polymerase III subunit gamma/tau n=1 Tax=Synechococcus elongatus PCC 11802 TaxID=2283154 RepID=A0AAT9JT91_SYNEL|nr:DNA polymerase III subunit gamma/tau [Synechococcus elongatus]QFZ92496.1 DNA polymerase III subunit gamma/tau [Synechococcus elongatus PCC 11802]